MPRPSALALAATIGFGAFPALASDAITFHFYGADNCPPCQAFKRDGLPVVNASAQAEGYSVATSMIARTEDIGTIGIYGDTDTLLRRAGTQLPRVYPPIFIVTDGDAILAAYEGDWRAAMATAEAAAE